MEFETFSSFLGSLSVASERKTKFLFAALFIPGHDKIK